MLSSNNREVILVAFVRFTGTGRSFSPRASLSQAGVIGLNDGARKRYQLDGYKFCVLYYDADTQRIGIELTNDEQAAGAQRVRFRPTGADVAAKSFVECFGIAVSETHVYPLSVDEETGYLTIVLAEGKPKGRRRRAKRAGTADNDGEAERRSERSSSGALRG